ncbi:MAG: hypothetical protein DWQ44_06310 [Bacteroidetes bacterium]|nr:MAG: hypothetical protein DWQ33_13245 [Bacteroidota bacterium]REK03376.1 MAG: hypothetical protein DWQ39_09210 [Bacteroidota bacterium]REK34512.1 MAG: hypothetical protein DWQ44_06310 [Bacteroidota bacterium]REK50370.1 MAG: hypothetical protein DWQ48_03360 [Bacteroidota bacterium]
MKKSYLLIFILVLLISVGAFGSGYRFGRLIPEKGLSHPKVYCSYQDSRGFMWFGTEDGLNKYDGYTFDVYKNNPTDSTSISNNIVRVIFEDSKRNLWVGTDNGLNLYNPLNGTFFSFFHRENEPTSLSGNIISAITEDKSGKLWIGTSRGLNIYDHSSKTFQKFQGGGNNSHGLSSELISALYLDKSGTLWAGTADKGLNSIQPESGRVSQLINSEGSRGFLSENEITCISGDSRDNLWIGTVNGGINKYNPKSGAIEIFNTEKGLASNSIFAVIEDKSGNIWIASLGGGLHTLDMKGKIIVHKHDPQISESISSNKVWSLFEDNAGTIWAGTSEGISFYNWTLSKFKTYRTDNSVESTSNNSVFAIYEDKNGHAWIGILGGGLNVFSKSENKFVNEKYAGLNDPLLKYSNIFSIAGDPTGLLWLGTGDGLLSYNPKTGAVRQFKNQPGDKESLSHNYIRSVFADREGIIWIGTHGGGLNTYNTASGKFKGYTHNPSDKNSISSDVVLNIAEGKEGMLLISTYGGGLSILNKSNMQFHSVGQKSDNEKGINSNYIHTAYTDKSGNIWIGTYGGGLSLINSKNEIIHFTENDGLPNNIVNGIIPDKNGNIWVTTNNGACRLSISDDNSRIISSTRIYNQQDGLQNKFNENACYAGKGGIIYLGGNRGLNAFYPDDIKENTLIPPVVITRFFLFEKPTRMDTLITTERVLKLNYRQNFFSFEFAGLNFLLPEKNRYAYKMEGLNEDWIYSGDRRYVAYTNVDPGHYVFRVKSCNNDGVWNEEGISIDITITPPFYKTWWFTLLSALGISLLIFSYIRIRTNTLVKQNIILEEKVNTRTHELQEKNVELTMTMDHLKSTQNQLIQSEKMASLGQLTAGIAHEIQNPLNFVNNFSELSVELLNEAEGESDPSARNELIGDVKQNLEKIRHHGRRADSIVKGMLQHSRASSAEKQSTDINKLVEEFFTLAYHGMKAKDPTFNCEMNKNLAADLPLVKIIPQEISRVILNIFNNAFYAVDEKKKLTQSNGYQPDISISTRKEDNRVLINIRDNGTGIKDEIKDKIFNPFFTTKPTGSGTGLGLSISYDIIVKGHGGKMLVESLPGEFTEFKIELPLS